jgi:hypothetical protein
VKSSKNQKTPLENVTRMVPEFKNEMILIQSSMENLILNQKYVNPFIASFDSSHKKNFVCYTRDCIENDPQDYYSSISTLFFAAVAAESDTILLAIHPATNPYFNPQNVIPIKSKESLAVFLASDSEAYGCEVQYKKEDKRLVWSENMDFFEIRGLVDPIIECLFVFSHTEESPFSYVDMLKYLSESSYRVMIVDEKSFANEVNNISKGVFKY